jgi:hypothetical protein
MSERAHSGILATPIPFRIRPSKCEEIRMEIGSEKDYLQIDFFAVNVDNGQVHEFVIGKEIRGDEVGV